MSTLAIVDDSGIRCPAADVCSGAVAGHGAARLHGEIDVRMMEGTARFVKRKIAESVETPAPLETRLVIAAWLTKNQLPKT